MTTAYSYLSLPKAEDSAISTPSYSLPKRLNTFERSSSSLSRAVSTSVNSAKTTIGNKARSFIPKKIAQLTSPVKVKIGRRMVDIEEDEAITPVLLYLDEGIITKQQVACSGDVDPFSVETVGMS
jgi:hypothetical protein